MPSALKRSCENTAPLGSNQRVSQHMAANAHPEIRIRKGGHWLTFPIQKRAVFPKIKPPARGATRRGGNQGIGWSPTDRAPHKQPRRLVRLWRVYPHFADGRGLLSSGQDGRLRKRGISGWKPHHHRELRTKTYDTGKDRGRCVVHKEK